MDKKWNVQNRKKGYLKIHIAVDIKIKEILALEITDEKVHDGRVLKKLVNSVLKVQSPPQHQKQQRQAAVAVAVAVTVNQITRK